MIKIEPTRNFTAPKSNLAKTTGENAGSENYDVATDTNEGSGEFARVLENLTSQKESADHKANELKPHEKDSHSKLDQHAKADQPTKNKDQDIVKREDAGGAAAAHSNINDNLMLDAEQSVPPARAIMHIADLERIVSSVRSQLFEGNSQIVITLKNSVCSGLQIKLTTDQNHRVTAELIAINEKVKAQIDARSGELADLLKQRGIKLTSLQTSLGGETAGQNGNQQKPENFAPSALSAASVKNSQPENEQNSEASETASTYRI
ncbi:MAG: hypothetical protein ABI954_05325 [Pyrinomonadaceae bacterium]